MHTFKRILIFDNQKIIQFLNSHLLFNRMFHVMFYLMFIFLIIMQQVAYLINQE